MLPATKNKQLLNDPSDTTAFFVVKNAIQNIILKKLQVIFLMLLLMMSSFMTAQVVTFIPTGGTAADLQKSYTIPACVTTITVEVWGGSGARK